jgi:hypothetical protein
MGEISGFGGGYESCCQDMLEAGMRWLTEHKDPDLQGKVSPQIFGILIPESEDAKALEKAVLDAAKGEATGAMHHAVMSRLFWISKNGWDAYCAELRTREADDGAR